MAGIACEPAPPPPPLPPPAPAPLPVAHHKVRVTFDVDGLGCHHTTEDRRKDLEERIAKDTAEYLRVEPDHADDMVSATLTPDCVAPALPLVIIEDEDEEDIVIIIVIIAAFVVLLCI